MKKILISTFVVTVVLLSFASINTAQATPMGNAQHPGHYFLGDEDLGRWSVGLHYLDRERDILWNSAPRRLNTTKTMGYVGYEVMYGMDAYVFLGSTESQISGARMDSHAEVGAGLQFNILDHEIPDPLLMEDRLRLNASLQYSRSGADVGPTEVEWEEIYGTLTVALINDVRGNKYYSMESIGFFFGAVYSDLRSSSADELTAFGFCAGMDFAVTEKVSFQIGMESIDDGSVFGGVHIGL